jgi:hypothetical protein
MKTYLLERKQIIPRSKSETFDFFSDAFNLERITPHFLGFRILTPRPIKMATGTIIEYELAIYGIPVKWRTLIESWLPEDRFVDTQIKGPYRLWRHTHTFEELGPNSTLVTDTVQYGIPFGPIGRLAHWLFVGKTLDKIFNYRASVIAELFGAKGDHSSVKTIELVATN